MTAHPVRRYFVTGLLTLIPIWLTWVVFKFVFVLLSNSSQPVVAPVLRGVSRVHPALEWLASGWAMSAVALAATLGIIFGIGMLAHRVVGQRLLAWFESWIQRIPLANMIYGSSRKLLDILQVQPGTTQRVVLIEFPHENMKVVGLVTRTFQEDGTGRELAAVYVPTTPNPTSGYLEIVPVDQITPTDWSVDQAMTFIISGGAVAPDTMPYSRRATDAADVTAPP
ncbi:DUF502 domain-containing protein [Coralloluteibacterium thermophilus]|uniref:DUF502 domain-containing protein n=1 Tax=Coralloluteibacterium thermophilum TaxID=2707049 RepID=A0ABV9NM28_9GAMM